MGMILTTEQRNLLLAQHRTKHDRRRADRIKAVLLRDDGWSYERIAAALFLSDDGVRRQIGDYLNQNGKLKPENGGSMTRLSDGQLQELDKHLSETIYLRTQDIVAYVEKHLAPSTACVA